MKILYTLFLTLSLTLSLTSCTEGTLKITDPATKVVAEIHFNTLWSDVLIDDFSCIVNKDGSRTFKFGNLSNNSSNGQNSFNKMLPGLVGSAIEGGVRGAGIAVGKPPL